MPRQEVISTSRRTALLSRPDGSGEPSYEMLTPLSNGASPRLFPRYAHSLLHFPLVVLAGVHRVDRVGHSFDHFRQLLWRNNEFHVPDAPGGEGKKVLRHIPFDLRLALGAEPEVGISAGQEKLVLGVILVLEPFFAADE